MSTPISAQRASSAATGLATFRRKADHRLVDPLRDVCSDGGCWELSGQRADIAKSTRMTRTGHARRS